MVTIGVDLAAQPARTAVCIVTWMPGIPEIGLPETDFDDRRLLELFARADKIGIDVPLGWPDGFVAAVTSHHRGNPWPGLARDPLRYRATDLFVHRQTGRWPLSVAASLLGIPAMRAAGLLTAAAEGRRPISRIGHDKVVEVYPAAALRRWGLSADKYKGPKGRVARQRLIARLLAKAPWLKPSEDVITRCVADDDKLDALIAALVARAAAKGWCDAVPPEHEAVAEREGWIALPQAVSLEALAETYRSGSG
jgi:predicted nuclease with RNAse H fold